MSTIKSSAENLTLNADGANNDIKFQSNGSEVASIDQAGLLTAGGGVSATGAVNSTGEMRVSNPSATSQLYLYGASGQKSNIILNEYGVRAWHIGAGTETSGQLSIGDGTTERMRFQHGGVVSIPSGIELGSGVDGTAANTLDDYEEGTWTPVMKDSSDRALSTNTGSSGAIYVKIGRQVTVTGRITTDSLGSASGQLMLTGLPFAAYGSSLGGYSGGTVGRAGNLNIASGTNIAFAVTYGQTHCEMTRWDDSVGTTDMQTSEWSADGWIMFCLVYQTA